VYTRRRRLKRVVNGDADYETEECSAAHVIPAVVVKASFYGRLKEAFHTTNRELPCRESI
jgi:hypothetical protein